MVKLMESFVSGSSYPAMTLLFHQQPLGALSIPQSRTALGKRRPSVVGVNTYLTDGLLSTQTQRNPDSYSTQIQGTENGPVIKTIAKLQHQLYIVQIEFIHD